MGEIVTDATYRFGVINILVNNASKQYMCEFFEDIDLDKTEDIFRTNIVQMIAMAKFALPHMSRGDSSVYSFYPTR